MGPLVLSLSGGSFSEVLLYIRKSHFGVFFVFFRIEFVRHIFLCLFVLFALRASAGELNTVLN